MSDTPCPFCGQIHGTACPGPHDIHTPLNPPPWFGWVVTDHTTQSGKQLFRCTTCGIESPTPDKWEYHADVCYAELHRRLKVRDDTLGILADAGALGKTLGCSCALTRFTDACEAVREDS